MRKIAVTGRPASGKSVVCSLIKKLRKATVVSADEIVHQLLSQNDSIKNQVVELLGQNIIEAGKIRRGKIATAVFEDAEKLQALEKILHPAVLDELMEKSRDEALIVAEVPLLHEAGFDTAFDTVIAVTAAENVRRKRFAKTHFEAREKNLLSEEELARRADYIINNEGSLSDLEKQIQSIIPHII